jgi:hypothetical protein
MDTAVLWKLLLQNVKQSLSESSGFPSRERKRFIVSWTTGYFDIGGKLILNTRLYPKVSRLASWSENCKWYSYLPLGAVVSLFCESV